MIPNSVNNIPLSGRVWSSALDDSAKKLYLDTRLDEDGIELVQLDLSSMTYESKKVENSRWTHLIGAKEERLFFVEYTDQHDPNKQQFIELKWKSGEKSYIDSCPSFSLSFIQPNIYEHSSEYHKTVSDFLGLELPLSCEYLEWGDKIIISHYLRSGNEFERHLLLLENGEKKWKVCQDTRMKGFSAGSFFVIKDQLIFIKDQNEICLHTL